MKKRARTTCQFVHHTEAGGMVLERDGEQRLASRAHNVLRLGGDSIAFNLFGPFFEIAY